MQSLSFLDLDNNLILKVAYTPNKNYRWNNGFDVIRSWKISNKYLKLIWNYFHICKNNDLNLYHSPFPSLPFL